MNKTLTKITRIFSFKKTYLNQSVKRGTAQSAENKNNITSEVSQGSSTTTPTNSKISICVFKNRIFLI
jgi:hypothetical protein